MIKRILVLLIVVSSVAYAADQTPSEASVKQLLEVSQVHKILNATMAQMDALMKQAMQQATQGQVVPPKVQKGIDQRQAEMMSIFKETLDWSKLEPMYVRVYQKSFTQPEIDNLIAMYGTPGAQTMLNKMPIVLQNTMAEMQQIMRPMMQRIQRMQQEVVAELQANKSKTGG
ncbi:MAG: uncharacterized protein QOF93_749 [Verrucomicrobiota bacterium]|jgi:hypothetical protein